MSKARLIRRLEWYYPTERFHTYGTVPMLIFLVLVYNKEADVIFLIYGLLVCMYILYQGQRYWKLKLLRLKKMPFDLPSNLAFFNAAKKRNQLLIAIMPVVFWVQYFLIDGRDGSRSLLIWGILANMFALLEYINYYHLQITIDNKYDWQYLLRNKRLKRASLAKDLADGEI